MRALRDRSANPLHDLLLRRIGDDPTLQPAGAEEQVQANRSHSQREADGCERAIRSLKELANEKTRTPHAEDYLVGLDLSLSGDSKVHVLGRAWLGQKGDRDATYDAERSALRLEGRDPSCENVGETD